MLTSLTDGKKFPAKDVVARYHERWELELGYDEIETEMLDRRETIRSRTVDGVGQELWGILLAYNLIRLEMERTADDLGVEPTQISFRLLDAPHLRHLGLVLDRLGRCDFRRG